MTAIAAITVGSLFSGIGGLELGLERAGMTVCWQVEKDDYAVRVLEKHWPEVPKHRDIFECGAHNLEPVDLICGGFPCQPVSVAGKRKGNKDERWLWDEFYRIICELRPKWVVAENVPGLLSIRDGKLFAGILRDLAAGGYDAEWQVLPASAFGAWHRRDRVFIVAYGNDHKQEQSQCDHTEWGCTPESRQGAGARTSGRTVFGNNAERDSQAGRDTPEVAGIVADANGQRELQPERTQQDIGRRIGNGGQDVADAERNNHKPQNFGGEAIWANAEGPTSGVGRCSETLPNANGPRLAERQVFGGNAGKELAALKRDCSTGAGIWSVEPDVGRVADGISRRVDRLRCLGNAVVPQVAEYIGQLIMVQEIL